MPPPLFFRGPKSIRVPSGSTLQIFGWISKISLMCCSSCSVTQSLKQILLAPGNTVIPFLPSQTIVGLCPGVTIPPAPNNQSISKRLLDCPRYKHTESTHPATRSDQVRGTVRNLDLRICSSCNGVRFRHRNIGPER
jgi:hypothetical protein